LTLLKTTSQYIDCAPLGELTLKDSVYDVTSQILSLISATTDRNPSLQKDVSWLWKADYIALDTANTSVQNSVASTACVQHLSFTVNGCLVYLLSLSECRDVHIGLLLSLTVTGSIPETLETTWLINNTILSEIESHLLTHVDSLSSLDKELLYKIPVFGAAHRGNFPYQFTNSK
jgi:hypothetical protein